MTKGVAVTRLRVGKLNEALIKHDHARVVVSHQKRASYTIGGAAAARNYVRQWAYPAFCEGLDVATWKNLFREPNDPAAYPRTAL